MEHQENKIIHIQVRQKTLFRELFKLRSLKKLAICMSVVFSVSLFLTIPPISAEKFQFETDKYFERIELTIKDLFRKDENIANFTKQLPENKPKEYVISYITERTLTAYNSEVGQCDSTPCITANGFNVCEHGIEDTIAANFLPFGTKVRIPDLFGDRVFVVRDRMNPRFGYKIDVWMLEKHVAKQFGVKRAVIQVLEKVGEEKLVRK